LAYEAWQFTLGQVEKVDGQIALQLGRMKCDRALPPLKSEARPKRRASSPGFDARTALYYAVGLDLTEIEGISELTALTLISEIGREALTEAEDQAIEEALALQERLGRKLATDGEFRRGSWHMDFLYQIGGVARTDQKLRIQFRNEAGPVEAALGAFRIDTKLTLDKMIFAEDFAYLKSVAPAGAAEGEARLQKLYRRIYGRAADRAEGRGRARPPVWPW